MTLGHQLPVWSAIPFIGLLLSIALCPLFKPEWWEKNMGKVTAFWGLVFVVPFCVGFGMHMTCYEVLHIYLLDYIPFIILVASLFTISGGIIVRGTLRGTPLVNGSILAIGSLLASWIGTTGASMLLIRPLIRAIKTRERKTHTIIFFIFMVSNIGGALTPLGDPPLFLGFLHGVPFFWTMHLATPMFLSLLCLLIAYLLIDSYFYKRESLSHQEEKTTPIRLEGLQNFIFIGGVIFAVIMSGFLNKHPFFIDPITGTPKGLLIMHDQANDLIVPWVNILRDSFMLVMSWLSLKFTSIDLRRDNAFTWGPIHEVAVLFAGIFLTMVPVMAMLQARGDTLGITNPVEFFVYTGALSSFLDNAPTYLTFLSLAGGLGAVNGVVTDLGIVTPDILLAISCGAVFMGANTYIGNAPNFMVKAIAEERKVKMPSFFGYLGWSLAILGPIYILNILLFFI